MKTHFLIAAGLIAGAWLATATARAQEVTKENVDGITNFHRLETTVACAGAIKSDAVPEIKKFGFASIINLREASEDGANIEQEAAAAKAVGLNYYSLPFNSANPDPAVADKFIEAITAKGSDPAFIHCAGGGRAATMWFIKRMVVDHWDVDKAAKEATDLGMTSAKLKQFAIDYAQAHRRPA
jgi:uncharacterized protein (TIGR01244 family)